MNCTLNTVVLKLYHIYQNKTTEEIIKCHYVWFNCVLYFTAKLGAQRPVSHQWKTRHNWAESRQRQGTSAQCRGPAWSMTIKSTGHSNQRTSTYTYNLRTTALSSCTFTWSSSTNFFQYSQFARKLWRTYPPPSNSKDVYFCTFNSTLNRKISTRLSATCEFNKIPSQFKLSKCISNLQLHLLLLIICLFKEIHSKHTYTIYCEGHSEHIISILFNKYLVIMCSVLRLMSKIAWLLFFQSRFTCNKN